MAIPSDPQTPTTLNIPSLVAFAVLSFFAIRYFFFAPSSSSTTTPGSNRGSRVDPQRIETVLQMFPQLTRRDIEWDLVRNGGSVQATTDRMLREGRLDVPPPNFRAQVPAGAAIPASSSRPAGAPATQKPVHADLITRYKLASRLVDGGPGGSGASAEGAAVDKGKGREKSGWSSNKAERQAALQRRREEMILAARRKMEERDRNAKA